MTKGVSIEKKTAKALSSGGSSCWVFGGERRNLQSDWEDAFEVGGKPRIWVVCEPNTARPGGSDQQFQVYVGPNKIRTKLITRFHSCGRLGHMSKSSFSAVMGVKASQERDWKQWEVGLAGSRHAEDYSYLYLPLSVSMSVPNKFMHISQSPLCLDVKWVSLKKPTKSN